MRIVRGVAAGVGALALLAGCGSGDGSADSGDETSSEASDFADQSGSEITDAAATDMKALSSLRMNGDITSDSEKIGLDLALTTDGDCQGSVSVQGGTAEIISLDGDSWFKPDEAFWQAAGGPQADQIIEMVGDNWVVLPPGDSDFTSFCDLDELLTELDDDGSDDVTVGELEDVDGTPAVKVTSETDEGDKVEAWVAAEGEHYILKMVVNQGEEPGTITFSDFNEEFDIAAPADDEVVDLSQLAG